MIINLGHLEDECGKGISKGKDKGMTERTLGDIIEED